MAFEPDDLRTQSRINDYNSLVAREGLPPDPSPPPLIPENLFSVCGPSQIFLLFSKVIADELLSAGLVFYPKMVLSTPNFSKAVD